jgi:hypothetical protein
MEGRDEQNLCQKLLINIINHFNTIITEHLLTITLQFINI